MNTVNERISFLIKDQGLTQSKFADRIHLTQAHVSRICSGTYVPTERTISDICREFNVSLAWLEDGEGEMYVQRSANEELALLVTDIMSDADDSFRKRFISLLMALPPEKWAAIEAFVEELQKKTFVERHKKTRERLTVPGFFCILEEGGFYEREMEKFHCFLLVLFRCRFILAHPFYSHCRRSRHIQLAISLFSE